MPTQALPKLKTPYKVATGKKPDLLQLCEWGTTVWVKQLDAGKLDPRAEEAHFVGFDDKSKGFWIYWPKKFKVSIERDVYFDKNQALQPDEVSIEGVEYVFTNSDTLQPSSTSQDILKDPEPVETTPTTPNEAPEPKNIKSPVVNLLKSPSSSPESPQNAPIPPQHQRTLR